MRISLRTIYYFLTIPVLYLVFSIILKGSVYGVDWKRLLIITAASFLGVTLGATINKKLK